MERCSYHNMTQHHLSKEPIQRLEEHRGLITAVSWRRCGRQRLRRDDGVSGAVVEFIGVEISKALTLLESRDQIVNPETEKLQGVVSSPAAENTVSHESVSYCEKYYMAFGLLRAGARAKTMGGWLKEQKEKKRAEARTRNAQSYAATSVAGVAAAVAAVVAGAVFSSDGSDSNDRSAKMAAAIASAAMLVASHCMEMAQVMGAGHDQIATAVSIGS
uniref:VAN3-binding protein-like auxin canalisation domain-containing protein n=1 Tax=Ananas comosus var. bracteatus TaxID=296719 RepID=A0A6V7QK62_ANACO|nr:unnamed protein product [Ananas comosus var. bracteatus]